jgi:hypothetical protein
VHNTGDRIVKECNVSFEKQRNGIVMFSEKRHCSAAAYTMFFFFSPGSRMYGLVGCQTLEHTTYSCPCEKHGFCRWGPAIFRYCTCASLMDIANARRNGNCILLKSNGRLPLALEAAAVFLWYRSLASVSY